MKKVISFIIAAAMLSAGVYAEDVVEVDSAAQEDSTPTESIVIPQSDYIEKYFAENGYPDYVSYIFNTGASTSAYDPSSGEEYQQKMTYWWEVGVAHATDDDKAEIQTLIDNFFPIENIVTFVECAYSKAEKEALVPEIRQTVKDLYPDAEILDIIIINNPFMLLEIRGLEDWQMGDLEKTFGAMYGELIIVSDGLDDSVDGSNLVDNIGVPEIGEVQPGRGEETVPATEIAIEEIVPEDGSSVTTAHDGSGEVAAPVGGDVDAAPPVDDTPDSYDGVVPDSNDSYPGAVPDYNYGGMTEADETYGEIAAITSPEKPANNNAVLWICIAAGLVVVLAAVALIYRAVPVFATSQGDIAARRVSRKQAEEAVKSSETAPSDEILQAIKEKINN